MAAVAVAAQAQITPTDVQIAVRALSFLQAAPRGGSSVGIVYNPGSPESTQEARHLLELLPNGLKVGNNVLQAALVPITEVTRSNAVVFFLASGVGADATALSTVTSAHQVPCITADLSQVQAGRCAVGVRSSPRIEIIVNRQAAVSSGTAFSTVFRMMITEI